MPAALKARRFSTLQVIFAATVLLMIAKAVALRNHVLADDWSRALGASYEQDESADDEGDTLARDGDALPLDGE